MKGIAFRWPIKVIFMLLYFGAIYTFNLWHQQRVIKEPLMEKLQQLEGVQNVEVSTLGNSKIIRFLITLSDVDNLPATYREMDELLLSTYHEDEYLLILTDNSNPYLESIYEKIQFALMEGERTGNYIKMNEEVTRLMEQEEGELSYRLWVDQDRIYLFLSSGSHYLYKIIPIKLTDIMGQV